MISIGVTGHRCLVGEDILQTGVDQALEAIRRFWPGESFTICSSLAEGADRLVVRCTAQILAARLVTPLPLPVEDYLLDFQGEESKREFHRLLEQAAEVIFLPPARSRPEAYQAAGRYLVEHCDILLALWDGKAARGKGGTAEIVTAWRKRGLPLAWVKCANCAAETGQPADLGEEHGMVTYENFDA
jgi:hypothetical protein